MVDLIFGWVGPRLRPLMSVGNSPLQRTRSRIIRTPATSVPITSGSMLRRLGRFASHNDSSYRPNVQSGGGWVERTYDLALSWTRLRRANLLLEFAAGG